MIVIDVPMPQRCMGCPCMCHVINERDDERAICQAKVVRREKYVYVNEYAAMRPEDCPIRVGVLGRSRPE